MYILVFAIGLPIDSRTAGFSSAFLFLYSFSVDVTVVSVDAPDNYSFKTAIIRNLTSNGTFL